MGELHLVLPSLNLSTLDAGILIKVQEVRLMMFSTCSQHGPSSCCQTEILFGRQVILKLSQDYSVSPSPP